MPGRPGLSEKEKPMRGPIIDQTAGISYTVEKDPFGPDCEEGAGYWVVQHDPRQQYPEIIGRGWDTPEEAHRALVEIAGGVA